MMDARLREELETGKEVKDLRAMIHHGLPIAIPSTGGRSPHKFLLSEVKAWITENEQIPCFRIARAHRAVAEAEIAEPQAEAAKR